jgi:DEAD/DEAH box helicase domain-containing protein
MSDPNSPDVISKPPPSSHQGKRKRNGEEYPSVGSPTSSQPISSKSRRGGKAGKGRPSLKKEASSIVVPCVVEWPEEFKKIERTHRALNLVYTFCTTRKHLATTFDTIKSAVEAHIKRELLVDEIASMVALRPEGIFFAYVDEIMLQLDVKGTERDEVFRTGNSFRSQAPAHDASVGGYTGMDSLDKQRDRDLEPTGREVLFLEFIDGDLKRQVPGKGGEPTKPNRKLRDEQLRMPVYSQKQMTNLIERRNQKFTNAINVFLNKCAEDKVDPLETIKEQMKAYVPVPTTPEELEPEKAAEVIPESIPKERKSVPDIVQELKESPWYTGQIVPDGHRVFEKQEPVYGDLNFLLSQDLVNALYNAKGITQFFAHQSEALNSLHDGKHVVVSTSTSSGKSLIYQLPVIRALEEDCNSRAMYIFPTKALAQDQKRSLKEMIGYMPGLEETMIETFDGDTPMTDRNDIREQARVIFTNPDMLHITILPQEERWRSYLKNLKYVVGKCFGHILVLARVLITSTVDELHYYNGQMGSHMSFIMRRLRRICAAVGNRHVKFISCSATVANPEQHFKTIFGIENVQLIDYDGSPSGRKEFLCWNTPYKDPGDPASGRGSTKFECARLFCALMLRGVRIIAFCRVRAQCELLVSTIKQELEAMGRPECTNLVMGYRGGYTAQDRRRIETEMFQGQLLGVVATTALELGIDIGSLDCVMTWGFPYTIANLRQQSGRAGRRNKDSLSILVGDGFATDQHYMQNPDELFTKPNCELQVDLENMLVREGHIQCAAYEMPIRPREDAKYFGKDLPKICLERLIRDDMGFYHCHDRFRPIPAKYVAIRDTEDDHFAIVDITNGRNVVLEELEASRATFTLYDGAIFLHQGNPYLVRDFQPDKGMARVERVKVEWTTVQRDYTDIDPTETEAIRTITDSRSHAYYGTIKIQQNVFGFFKVDKKNRVLDAVQVDNPPVIRFSKGMWLDVPKKAMSILQERRLHIAAAIHAAEHAMMSLLPAFVISMPGDVRTECKTAVKEFAKQESQRKRPARLTFYDAKGGAGGSGISTKAFDHVDQLLRDALQRVENCRCERGCVECVASEQCKQMNEVMSKAGSQVILKTLLNIEVDMDSLPMGPELNIPIGTETVVLAGTVPYRAKEAAFDNNAININGRVAVERKGSGDGAKTGDSGTPDGGGGFEHWLADSI